MSYTRRAALSIGVSVVAAVVLIARANTIADIAGGLVVAVALLVFIRAILGLAGDSGEQPAAPEQLSDGDQPARSR
jgi:hypothetical protein